MKVVQLFVIVALITLFVCSSNGLQTLRNCKNYWPTATNPNPQLFYEYLPPTFGNGTAAPVIIFLHGVGQGGTYPQDVVRILGVGLAKLIDTGGWPANFPFVVLSPWHTSGWPDAITVQSTLEALPSLYGNKVDLTRVYVTGLSAGGGGTIHFPGLSLANANRIAAVVPIAIAWYDKKFFAPMANSGLPFWGFANEYDSPFYNITGTVTNALNGLGINPPAKFTVYKKTSGHGGWDQTYNPVNNVNDIYSWMLKYSTTNRLPPTPTTTTSTTTI
ncbi:hypothetical protein SAMD00019534_107280 [Acytostelium subglobosum LB1]|uniref:hypothetical protein n=1 Tax=Acytostelium subglobosum LB1 TaxID=1410327 RepID=UPI00064508C4|nr:hypothetical protein SAMD00019534_107280 [Acytostelium subglobosum LB1]GAM27552.1 hypothetical protein SAMD00019534_107280 [Acytostelium subglobosum LB1]|eukprot:XP_012749617.1 hypothetical protein SAMD00019534_107280 [Acytostelium subglobosum LB1]